MRKSTALLLLATGVLAATTIGSWRALVNERARAESLQAHIELEKIRPTAAAPDLPIAAPPDAGDQAASSQDETPSAPPEFGDDEAHLLQNEAYREARRRFRQLELASGHIDLARILGISQGQADRLLALLVDREIRYLSQPHPNPSNEEEMRTRRLEIQQAEYEQDLEIAALIGESKLPKWKDYQSSLPVRHQVQSLGSKLFAIAEPLRADQVEPLISVIHAERKRVRQELVDYTASLTWSGGMEQQAHAYRSERLAELTKTANERIHAGASSILSSKQLQVLDDMMQRESALYDSRELMWRKAAQVSGGTD